MVQKVFIPQVTMRYCDLKQRRVPAHDLTPAAAHGQLTPILDESDDPSYLARLTPRIREALESYTADDFLLAVGDPALIAVCSGIILRKFPSMKLLKWDRKLKIYILLEICP